MIEVQDISGAWLLESFEIEKDGEYHPWGSGLRGLLIYTPEGFVSVGINRKIGEPGFSSEADSLFYSGTYSIQDDSIVHSIVTATGKDKVDRELHRKARLSENSLELSGLSESGLPFRLLWRRA